MSEQQSAETTREGPGQYGAGEGANMIGGADSSNPTPREPDAAPGLPDNAPSLDADAGAAERAASDAGASSDDAANQKSPDDTARSASEPEETDVRPEQGGGNVEPTA
jgi:hypothetical protein